MFLQIGQIDMAQPVGKSGGQDKDSKDRYGHV
jgi:hypothetical protein